MGDIDPRRVIPRTQLFKDYRALRDMTEAPRLARAEEILADPAAFATFFEESRSRFVSYENQEPFFPERTQTHTPGEDLTRTPDVILRLPDFDVVTPTDEPGRKALPAGHRKLRDVAADELAFEYVEREILVHRTSSPAAWDDGARNLGGLRPDVLCATAVDRVPVMGELKTYGDMDPFFALHQGLTGVAHLRTPAQYERMRAYLPRGRFPAAPEPPRFDVYVLFVPPVPGAKVSENPRYQPRLAEIAEELAYRLLECDDIARSVRRIAALSLQLDGPDLVARVRYAYERPEVA